MSNKIVESIEAGRLSKNELINVCINTKRTGNKELRKIALKALKELDPKSHTKIYIKPIQEKIKLFTQEIADAENLGSWEDNTVANEIKPGDGIKNGTELAEFIIPYRAPKWKKTAHLAVYLHDEETEIKFKVKAHDAEEVLVDNREEAVKLFRDCLSAK